VAAVAALAVLELHQVSQSARPSQLRLVLEALLDL
jgi:hypothetical protein